MPPTHSPCQLRLSLTHSSGLAKPYDAFVFDDMSYGPDALKIAIGTCGGYADQYVQEDSSRLS